MTTHRFRDRGFTLIEVLIALTLLALLIAMGYGAMRTAIRSARSGEALIARTEELRTAQSFLRRQLNDMLSIPFATDARDGTVHRFDGSAEAIRYVAPMPGHLSRGGAHVQRLSLQNADGGLRLQFEHAQLNGYDDEEGFPEQPLPVVLMTGIAAGRFIFRTMEADGQLSDWSSDWDEPESIPLQIALELEFNDGDPRVWPPLVVSPRASLVPTRLTFDRPMVRPPGAGTPPRSTE